MFNTPSGTIYSSILKILVWMDEENHSHQEIPLPNPNNISIVRQ